MDKNNSPNHLFIWTQSDQQNFKLRLPITQNRKQNKTKQKAFKLHLLRFEDNICWTQVLVTYFSLFKKNKN